MYMTNTNTGWAKIHRTILESTLWVEDKFTRGQAWVDLILLANHTEGYLRVAGEKIPILRGQTGWSIEKLSLRWQWSRGKTERFLNELETSKQIVQQKTSRTTVITIINYETNIRQVNRRTLTRIIKKK